jgi:hypothetical protein
MPRLAIANLGGLNLQTNPLLLKDGDMIRSVNVDCFPFGAKSKRPGYGTFLGTADGSAPTSLFSWTKNDGTSLFLYRASGSLIHYSTQGTGAWTVADNGTISPGAHVGYTVLDNTLIVGDGVGAARHTTNGTAFTNTSLAPIGEYFNQYQNRVYVGGTSSTLFYSTTGDATNWSTSGTSDSSSIDIPGAGKLNGVFKLADRIVPTKNSGLLFRWDGFSLVDTATKLGPTSPYSFAKSEDYAFWLNNLGFFGSGGDKPQLLSNPIQRQIYNDSGSAVVGSVFGTAPAEVHRYDYYCAVGDTTDDLTAKTVGGCIMKYNYQLNEWGNYSFANFPSAFHSYKDANGVDRLIFGDSSGQCFTYGGTALTDNGSPIEAVMEFLVHGSMPFTDKKWNWCRAVFNPGSQAKIQVAVADRLDVSSLNWVDLGDTSRGFVEYRFPQGSRGHFLFVRISENSTHSRFSFYGFEYDFDPIQR